MRREVSLTEIGKKYSLDISMSGEHDMLCELSLILSPDAGGSGVSYIEEIVYNLELVLAGKIDEYEFGFDATIIDFRKNKATVNYDYFENQIEMPPETIYGLVKDWYEFLTQPKR